MTDDVLHEDTEEERLLDRLVDGELADPQRRALLERLDAVPGGWRRCALAFLEAQSWGEGLRVFARRREPVMPATDEGSGPSLVQKFFRVAGAGFALAASLLIAFQLGQKSPLAPSENPAPPQIATVQPAPQPATPRESTALADAMIPPHPVPRLPAVEGSVIDPWRHNVGQGAWPSGWTHGGGIPVHNVGLRNGQ